MNKSTNKIVTMSIFAALVAILTMFFKYPVGNGYIHLGDTMVYLSGIFLGPIFGGIAAGFGSAMADMLSGYPIWAFPSFIIKFLVAVVFGVICKNIFNNSKSKKMNLFKYFLAVIIATLIMSSGYFLTSMFLYSKEGAISEIPGNLIQGVTGGILAYPLLLKLKNYKFNK